MNSGVGKNYPFCDFETTSANLVSYLELGEEVGGPQKDRSKNTNEIGIPVFF
jgi:hypothetical protein